MRNQRFWYAAAAATVLLAAGCNGGADNQPSPTPTPTVSSPTASPSDSGSPSPSASVSIPAEAMAQTPEGAVAFVKFYTEQINSAWIQPNAQLLEPLSDATCQSCAALQATAASLVQTQEKYLSPVLQLDSAAPSDGAPSGQQFILAQMQQLASKRVDSAGTVKDEQAAQSATRQFVLIWQEGRWLVFGIA